VVGQNITIEPRWAEGRFERLPDLAAELVRLKVDIIVASAQTVKGGNERRRLRPPVRW
jgi:putative ABC transport system substrate-binding protein